MYNWDFYKIARNNSYELLVHKTKNYALLSFLGIWNETAQLEYYLDDLNIALKKMSEGFNLLIDLREYRGSTSEFLPLHIEAQKLAINAGLNKTAVILQNNPMLKITVDYIFQQAGIQASYFDNELAAENWFTYK